MNKLFSLACIATFSLGTLHADDPATTRIPWYDLEYTPKTIQNSSYHNQIPKFNTPKVTKTNPALEIKKNTNKK